MNIFFLVWQYLGAKPFNTLLNILLLALGIAVITILLLFNNQIQQKITDNARGIDLVIGAKGSPLQLILCNIFHVDFPTGNIKLWEAEKFAKNRLVKKAVPLALGDSYNGFRIIGTNTSYPSLYDAEVREGVWWHEPMQVVLGTRVAEITGLSLGSKFESAHGLTMGGHTHEAQSFVVKGILKETNSVMDNLILTSVESIWQVHDEEVGETVTAPHGQYDHHQTSDTLPNHKMSRLVPSVAMGDSTKEITALLIQYRSPMGAIQLPRLVNSKSSMQAASPAFETARLFSILGVGVEIVIGFAYVLILVSALSIFIALYNSLRERRYDLAIMRSMGATRLKLFMTILLEGTALTLMGSLIGIILGHGVVALLVNVSEGVKKAGISGLIFYTEEWIILAGSLFLGVLCAFIPAMQAYKTDISRVLAES
jgi:putative ABC transport system permease protein